MPDLLITWPKSKSLEAYLAELTKAQDQGLVINFRVPSKPQRAEVGARCYVVHDGAIRGWNRITEITYRGEREVAIVESGIERRTRYWPAGWYIVRNPQWWKLADPIPYRGFQGYRYFEGDRALDQRPTCPDEGTCHHFCTDKCFRVQFCEPLSAAGWGDTWPQDRDLSPVYA